MCTSHQHRQSKGQIHDHLRIEVHWVEGQICDNLLLTFWQLIKPRIHLAFQNVQGTLKLCRSHLGHQAFWIRRQNSHFESATSLQIPCHVIKWSMSKQLQSFVILQETRDNKPFDLVTLNFLIEETCERLCVFRGFGIAKQARRKQSNDIERISPNHVNGNPQQNNTVQQEESRVRDYSYFHKCIFTV